MFFWIKQEKNSQVVHFQTRTSANCQSLLTQYFCSEIFLIRMFKLSSVLRLAVLEIHMPITIGNFSVIQQQPTNSLYFCGLRCND